MAYTHTLRYTCIHINIYIFSLTVFSLSSCSPKQSIRFLTFLFSFSGFLKCPGVENWIQDHIHAHAGLLSSIPNRWLLSQTFCPVLESKLCYHASFLTFFKIQNHKNQKAETGGQLSSRHAHCSCGGSELGSQHPYHTAQFHLPAPGVLKPSLGLQETCVHMHSPTYTK